MPARTARSLAIFMGAMTAFWATNILAVSVPLAVVGYVVGAALVAGVLLLKPKHAGSTTPAPAPGGARRHSRVFALAVLLESVATLVAVVILAKTGHSAYIIPVIGLIVALHFFVFLIAQPFVVHLIAGTIGTLVAIAAIVLMATGAINAAGGQALVGAGLGFCTAGYGAVFLRHSAASRQFT